MSCRGGCEHLKPGLPPEMSPRETAVFLMCLCAVVDDSSQSATAEEEPERGLGPPLLPAAWAGSALLRVAWLWGCEQAHGLRHHRLRLTENHEGICYLLKTDL